MTHIKLFCALFFFITSTCAHAIIVEGKFTAWITNDRSSEGIWSKNLSDSEITGQFWYDDSVFVPDPDSEQHPQGSFYVSYTNSWLNLIYFIDGKTIDISNSVASSDLYQSREYVSVNANHNHFSIQDTVVAGNPSVGDHVLNSGYFSIESPTDIIQHNGLEQNFSWVDDGSKDDYAQFWMRSRSNGQQYEAILDMYLTELTVATREASVPAPSPLPLLLIGVAALACRRRAYL
ncbi:MAG: hypothetical protein V4660_09520 [Pseudomonadota bacterium]